MAVGIFGAQGQMGKVLTSLYREERPGTGLLLIEKEEASLLSDQTLPDVVIDFSSKDALDVVLGWCTAHQIPVVLAVTGYGEDASAKIKEASLRIPVFQSANLSLGIFVLKVLVKEAVRLLGDEADIELIERHHKHKKDAPSGTALLLLDAVRQERDIKRIINGRQGTSPREAGEIGVHAVRGGSIVGDHTLLFALESEVLELSHRGESRKLFAKGAMKAADFIQGQAPGLYGMEDLFQAIAQSRKEGT